MKKIPHILLSIAISLTCLHSFAQEDVIRKNLAERIAKLPKIDEVTRSPMTGLYEVRVGGSDIYYTDAGGNYLVDGHLIDTKSGRNLTEERMNKLSAVNFNELQLRNAIYIKRGTGARKLAIFEDPNCGYCKRFEADLKKIDNVTIYLFLYPILGADSVEKSKNIWCAKDQVLAWQRWMLEDRTPREAYCNAEALDENIAFGKKYRITGTPTILLANGMRVPGAIPSAQLEKLLAEVK